MFTFFSEQCYLKTHMEDKYLFIKKQKILKKHIQYIFNIKDWSKVMLI